jgi:hypothetical protein
MFRYQRVINDHHIIYHNAHYILLHFHLIHVSDYFPSASLSLQGYILRNIIFICFWIISMNIHREIKIIK